MMVVPRGSGPMNCRNEFLSKIVAAGWPLIITVAPGSVNPLISRMWPCWTTPVMRRSGTPGDEPVDCAGALIVGRGDSAALRCTM